MICSALSLKKGYIVSYCFLEETRHEICPSAFFSDLDSHHTSSIGMFLSGQRVWVAHHSFFELRCHYFYRAAHSDLERKRTDMCLTLHQEDKNRPSLHAPRGHEVAYGLLMSPHINLRFNYESPKRRDATTSDLRGGTLHCINPPWTRSPSPLPSFPSLLLMSLVRST